MAKSKEYFGLEMNELLLSVAVIMGIFSVVLVVLDLGVYFSAFSGRYTSTLSNILFTYGGALMYGYTAFQNCGICFAGFGENAVNFFNSYNVIAFVAVICALIDGIRRLGTSHMAIPITFFAYSLIGFLCLFITCIPSCTQNLDDKEESQDEQYQVNMEQGTSAAAFATVQDAYPKYEMPVHVENESGRGWKSAEQEICPIFHMPVHVGNESDRGWQSEKQTVNYKSQFD